MKYIRWLAASAEWGRKEKRMKIGKNAIKRFLEERLREK